MMCDYQWLITKAERMANRSNQNPQSVWGQCPTHTVVVDHPDGHLLFDK